MDTRSPSINEYDNVVKFLDQNLRPNAQWSISAEYPTALVKENIHNIRIIKDGDKVLSHAVIRPMILKTQTAIFKVATIGSVVTETSHRNQGLSKMILNDCLQQALSLNCDFAVLWTNLYDFYRQLNFELCGYEISMIIDKDLGAELNGLKVIKGTNVDPNAVLRLMNQHLVTSVRTADDIKKYFSIPNARIYTAWSPQGNLEAYAVEGKGADLDGYIHEWGGGVSKLLPLFNYIYRDQKRPINVIAPPHSENLIRSMVQQGATTHEGYLGMFRILNIQNFFSKIHRHARQDLGITDFVLEESNGQYKIGTQKEILTTSNPLEMNQIIFGPKDVREILRFSNETAEVLNRIFPLRIWFWGWDSV